MDRSKLFYFERSNDRRRRRSSASIAWWSPIFRHIRWQWAILRELWSRIWRNRPIRQANPPSPDKNRIKLQTSVLPADVKLTIGIIVFRERTRRFANGVSSSPSANANAGGQPAVAAPFTPPAAPAVDPQWESDVANPLRRITFYFALAAIYIRFSVIHEMLAVLLNLNLYLLYIFMPPAILGVLATGGIRRTLAARSSKYWVAFLFWLFLSTPFSAWRGGIGYFTFTRTQKRNT